MSTKKPSGAQSYFDVIREIVTGSSAKNRTHQQIGDFVQKVLPRCQVCDKVVMIPVRCSLCGGFHCESHLFMNDQREGVCIGCLEENGITFESNEEDELGFPWQDLGISPTLDVERIKKAFKRRVGEVHPDHGGDPGDFQRVRSAYENALEYAKGRR